MSCTHWRFFFLKVLLRCLYLWKTCPLSNLIHMECIGYVCDGLVFFMCLVGLECTGYRVCTQNVCRYAFDFILNNAHQVILRTDKIDMFSEVRLEMRMLWNLLLATHSSQALAGTTLPGGLQLAWTKYNILSSYGRRCSLLDLELVTGFKHQLRAHLADGLTCPVLGDHKFAGPLMRKYPALKKKLQSLGPMGYTKGRMYLHAYQVQIIDYFGVQRPLTIMAPLPPYFVQALKSLGLQIPSKYRNRILSVWNIFCHNIFLSPGSFIQWLHPQDHLYISILLYCSAISYIHLHLLF